MNAEFRAVSVRRWFGEELVVLKVRYSASLPWRNATANDLLALGQMNITDVGQGDPA